MSAVIITSDALRAAAQAYMTAYFRQQLLNDPQYHERFKGEWVPPSLAIADGGKAKLFSQFREAAGAAIPTTVNDWSFIEMLRPTTDGSAP